MEAKIEEMVPRADVLSAIEEMAAQAGAEAAKRIADLQDKFRKAMAEKDAEFAALRSALDEDVLEVQKWLRMQSDKGIRRNSYGAALRPSSAFFLYMQHKQESWHTLKEEQKKLYINTASLLDLMYHQADGARV